MRRPRPTLGFKGVNVSNREPHDVHRSSGIVKAVQSRVLLCTGQEATLGPTMYAYRSLLTRLFGKEYLEKKVGRFNEHGYLAGGL